MALVASHLIGMGNSEFNLTKARAVIETAMGVVLLRLMAMVWASRVTHMHHPYAKT